MQWYVFFEIVISFLYYILIDFKCLGGSILSIWKCLFRNLVIASSIHGPIFSSIHLPKWLLNAYCTIEPCIVLVLKRLTVEGGRQTSKMRTTIQCNRWRQKIANRELETPEEKLLCQCKNSVEPHCPPPGGTSQVAGWVNDISQGCSVHSLLSLLRDKGNWVCGRSWYLPCPQRGQYGARKIVSVSCTWGVGVVVGKKKIS